nr:hypothetical protein OG296_30810 [Streptomyces sp. NBC_01001]
MVVVRTASSATRARRPAGPLRLMWLAALLFAFLYTHAAGADSASAHVTGGAVAVSYPDYAEPDGADHRDEGNGHSHPAETCASGHPQQGSELPAPPLVPLGDLTPDAGAMRPALWARTVPSGLPPLRSSLGSVVLQV